MAAVLEKRNKRWTYADYAKLGDDQRYEMKDLYARFGVKEFWIGDPANKSLEILTLRQNGQYELHCAAESKGRLSSLVLAALEFDLAEIL